MKKLTILSPIHAAMLLSVLFLASCGGDDSPTAPGGGRLDSQLFGTWVEIEEGEGEDPSFITFREDGSATFSSDLVFPSFVPVPLDSKWWIEGGQLMIAIVETFEYAISNGELTFTAVGNGAASFLAFSAALGVAFTADGDPGGLTGVSWVTKGEQFGLEGRELELVFGSEGTVNLDGDGGYFDVHDDVTWTWTAEGRTLTIQSPPYDEGVSYEIRGNTLDFSWGVFSKQ